MADMVATPPRVRTAAPPARRSPLGHRAAEMELAGRSDPDQVTLREVPFLTQFNLRLRYADRPPAAPETLLRLPSPPGLGPVRAIFEDQPTASDAVHRKAEDRPRTGRTRATPTTQRGAVADAVGPRRPAGQGLALPRTPNTVHRAGDRAAIWLGPDEWLIVTPPGTAAEVEGPLREVTGTAVCGAYTDVSANSTALRLSGRRSRDVLRKVCSLDVHPRVFGRSACAQTLLARAARVLLVADGEPDGFLIFVRASFADYVADWLLDAMAEYTAGTDHRKTITNEMR